MAKTKRAPQVIATREEGFARMRAALVKTCGDIYDDALLDERAEAVLNDLLRKGAVVIAGAAE